jgi:2-polyprenyl-6-methoxyphenol hydroxylase-like FAD-dependent oxidoreductase
MSLPPGFCHEEIWGTYGTGQQFGGCAIGGDRIYWFALVNRPEQDPEITDDQKSFLLDRFGNWHEPIPALIAATNHADILRHNTYHCRPNHRWGEGSVTLLGDAAHLMAPTYGQGACQALEDALVLSRCVAQNSTLVAAFRHYEQYRFPRVAKLQQLSHQIGVMMQWQNPLLARLRNATLNILPNGWLDDVTGINAVFGYHA